MKNLIILALYGFLVYGCSNSTPKTENAPIKKNELEITNDMEHALEMIPSWFNEKSVIKMKDPKAHSGEYACATNATIEYGYTYVELFKNINSVLPTRIDVNGWIYTTVIKPNCAVILDISQNNQLYDWRSYPLTKMLPETGKWVKFNTSFYFDKPLNPDQTLKIFFWNQSKESIYVDDLQIKFYYNSL